jgi:hypothetical protein
MPMYARRRSSILLLLISHLIEIVDNLDALSVVGFALAISTSADAGHVLRFLLDKCMEWYQPQQIITICVVKPQTVLQKYWLTRILQELPDAAFSLNLCPLSLDNCSESGTIWFHGLLQLHTSITEEGGWVWQGGEADISWGLGDGSGRIFSYSSASMGLCISIEKNTLSV